MMDYQNSRNGQYVEYAPYQPKIPIDEQVASLKAEVRKITELVLGLSKAVKEKDASIEELKTRMDTLENHVTTSNKKLDELKTEIATVSASTTQKISDTRVRLEALEQ